MYHRPMWKTNLVICVTIVALVAGYFFYQVQRASEQFRKNSLEHSKVLAAAVELNIRNALLSNDGLERIIADFLKNSAHFISYLDIIERFTAVELAAFAKEAGLAGITIISEDGLSHVDGPINWGPKLSCDSGSSLKKYEKEHLYTLVFQPNSQDQVIGGSECVIVGFPAGDLERVQKDVSVETLLERLSSLPGILSVQLMPVDGAIPKSELQLAKLVEKDGKRFTETRIRMGANDLVVTQLAGHFAKRLHQMRTEFFLFITFLVVLGLTSSWWLYHVERLRLKEAREYEQEMARQHEEATLGRAAATIAHEIRNPLNAIGMGLQRLQLEAEGLDEEHSALLVAMREAVSRSNTIVSSLQQYVRSFEVAVENVDISNLLRNVLQLYQIASKEQGVDVVLRVEDGYTVPGDSRLLGQLFENVIKNAIEAQPGGGFCHVTVQRTGNGLTIEITNGGFRLSHKESGNIFEPYFTSKTQGTGLGLAISRKIVEAHGGTITALPDVQSQQLTLVIELPDRQVS